MRKENKKQQERKAQNQKKGRAFPEEDTFAPKTDDTSMSSGNLVNNPKGRSRTRDLHTKIAITGTDSDGQTD